MNSRSSNEALNIARESKAIYNRIRLPLDEGLDKSQNSFNVFNKPFRGMWVSNISSNNVKCDVIFNSQYDSGSSIALRKNMVINHEQQVINATFTAPKQIGEWVEVTFSINSEINIGNIEQTVTGEVSLTSDTLNKLSSLTMDICGREYPTSYLENDSNLYYGSYIMNGNAGWSDASIFLNSTMSMPLFDFGGTSLNQEYFKRLKFLKDNNINHTVKVLAIRSSHIQGDKDVRSAVIKWNNIPSVGSLDSHLILNPNDACFLDGVQYPIFGMGENNSSGDSHPLQLKIKKNSGNFVAYTEYKFDFLIKIEVV